MKTLNVTNVIVEQFRGLNGIFYQVYMETDFAGKYIVNSGIFNNSDEAIINAVALAKLFGVGWKERVKAF